MNAWDLPLTLMSNHEFLQLTHLIAQRLYSNFLPLITKFPPGKIYNITIFPSCELNPDLSQKDSEFLIFWYTHVGELSYLKRKCVITLV